MRSENRVRFLVLAVVCCLWFWCCSEALGESDGNSPGQKQIEWLNDMQDLHDTGLVESYEDINDANAWTFDQALAVIAFTEAGEPNRARDVLDVMESLQRDDPNGAWYECYHVDDPNEVWDNCKLYNTGPIAWMLIAINYYEYRTGDCNYAPMARRALEWLDTMWNTGDPNKFGSLRYCEGPACTIPYSTSTEHNLDAYSAYHWRGILDSNDSYIEDANLILNCLRRKLWAPSEESIGPWQNVTVFWRGFELPVDFCTDPQSWGVLALGPIGPDGEEFKKSLDWLLDSVLQTTCDFNEAIKDVNGFKSMTGESCDYVRVDLTESVAAAFYSIGDDANGDYFHNEMIKTVDGSGGFVHSFNWNRPECEDRRNYVASVAWHYFNEVKINPFHPVGYPGCWNCATQCHGDADCDGDIDTVDWPAFRDGFAKSFPSEGYIDNACGDYDHDGDIDTEDWPEFRDNFGTSPPADCNVAGTWPPL